MRPVAYVLCLLLVFPNPSHAFGPGGHKMVGAIADQRLANTATAMKLNTLLGGLSLERVALIPDELKSHNSHPGSYVLSGHPALTQQLREYLIANPHNGGQFDHHAYHYTDVPVAGNSKYADGTVGRSPTDVVQMMKFCIGVLDGSESATNPRKITKPVAAILLAHFVGDIHQPLHVGAEFFDNMGQVMNPDTQAGQANSDVGGNNLTLHLRDASGQLDSVGSMHSYWDDKAAKAAFGLYRDAIIASGGTGITDDDIAKFLKSKTPAGFSVPTSAISKWSHEWADEILPVAQAAHKRLDFSNILINTHKHTAAGQALEKPVASGADDYAKFAGKVVQDKIHLAGWRLALVLEKSLQ